MSELIIMSNANEEIVVPALVERIAAFVSEWGRASETELWKCKHNPDIFCEQYGCASFRELADEIRAKFSAMGCVVQQLSEVAALQGRIDAGIALLDTYRDYQNAHAWEHPQILRDKLRAILSAQKPTADR